MKIKICGITTLQDALMAIEAGADMLGFNFYPKSPRYITPSQCGTILKLLGDLKNLSTGVGVFVNSPVAEIKAVLEETGLQAAQLSGDEPVEALVTLGTRGFKAVRLSGNGRHTLLNGKDNSSKLIQELAGYRKEDAPAFLLDSLVRGTYGGTGIVANWDQAADLATRYSFLLAGGLTPENIATAVTKVRPWGVDVASGVETLPGRKDENKVRQFILNARTAEKQLKESIDKSENIAS